MIRGHEVPAGEIAAAFEVTPSTISQHLAVLRAAGLVTMRVDGSFRRYRIDPRGLAALRRDVLEPTTKWMPADDLPEQTLATARRSVAVTVETALEQDVAAAFRAFVDPALFSRWLGVPVTLDGGRFATTLEFGTTVRGSYEVVVPETLLALRWDFDDDAVPVPGSELSSYVRFEPSGPGCRVVVHQLADDAAQADFLEVAWSVVLDRLRSGLAAALASGHSPARRGTRTKHRSGPEPDR